MAVSLDRVVDSIIGQSPAVNPTSVPFLPWYRATIPKSWQVASHIEKIAEVLDRVSAGDIDRFAVHMPPRHGKSETVTVRFAVKWIEEHPGQNVLVTGYNERFARKFNRKIRQLCEARGLVSPSKTATDEWETTKGGLVMARGVGSPPTGTGFGLILIDDPVRRREDADSEVYRQKVWDWYTDDLYSRLEPDGVIGITMTLWHEDDLGARAVASEPYTVLKLPAVSDEGLALWPERFPIPALERIKSVLKREEGERSWEALYQQNPTPLEGAVFKVGKIGRLTEMPPVKRSCMAWDFGYSTNGDYTVGCKVSETLDGRFVVEKVTRGQYTPEAKREAINDESRLAYCRIRLPQDPGAGKEHVQQIVKMLAGCDVIGKPVSKAKEVRAQGVAAQCEAGNLFIMAGAWNSDFIEELRGFPLGRHDDQVDALSDAFNEICVGRDVFIV